MCFGSCRQPLAPVAQVVVAGSAIGEMAMHFIEQAGLMAVRIPSKFDLRRFCRCVQQRRQHCGAE